MPVRDFRPAPKRTWAIISCEHDIIEKDFQMTEALGQNAGRSRS